MATKTFTLAKLRENCAVSQGNSTAHQFSLDFIHAIHVLISLGYLPPEADQAGQPLTLRTTDLHAYFDWETQRQRAVHRQESVHQFLTTGSCRMQAITAYFGEVKPLSCHHCDSCQPELAGISVPESQERKKYWHAFQTPPPTDRQKLSRFTWFVSQHTVKYLALNSLHSIEVSDSCSHIPGLGVGSLKQWGDGTNLAARIGRAHLE